MSRDVGVPSRPVRTLAVCAALACLCALAAATAGAAIVTVGPKLSEKTIGGHYECTASGGCTLSEDTPSFTSPVTGAIVKWRVKGAHGPVGLRVLNGNKAGSLVPTEVATKPNGPIETFEDVIPINTGERFGVQLQQLAQNVAGFATTSSSKVDYWSPALASNETHAPKETRSNEELLVNVDIQPAPGITSVSPSSGPAGDTTPVAISGHDFKGVSSVEIGGQIVAFDEVSESEISADAFGFSPGAVAVTVTTRAGSATLPAGFTLVDQGGTTPPLIPPVVIPEIPEIPPLDLGGGKAGEEEAECHVPKLKGKKLPAVKAALAAAHCKLGSVSRRKGVTNKHGKVVSSLPPAGSRAPAGAHVRVHLG